MPLDTQAAPIKIAILAMGGEGGGVLADWIVAAAEHAGFHAQNTSVPGVAQRTGATLYYVEILPVPRDGTRAPFLGLMPVPGDVDVVLASELMESARAVQRGLVTPDKTLLIASSNRVYAMPEKMAMGDGRQNYQALQDAGRRAARHFVCRDFAAIAQQSGSVISSALFGALAAAEVLPLSRRDFEATIERSGVGVAGSLAAFDAGHRAYGEAGQDEQNACSNTAEAIPSTELDTRLKAHAQRIGDEFPGLARDLLAAGVARTADYQDPAYAHEYLNRLRPIAALDAGPDGDGRLLRETARHLALWMTYEDTVRVAELKIRAGRFERVRREQQPQAGQLLRINDFFHPRVEEIADTLPAGLGNWLLNTGWARRLLESRTRKGRVIRSNRLGGFLLLYGVAAMRGMRRRSLRHQREQAAVADWLDAIVQHAARDYDLACEIAACQNLVKGYGDTHARGLANYRCIMSALPSLAGRPDAAQELAELRRAALADDQGLQLGERLAGLAASPLPQA